MSNQLCPPENLYLSLQKRGNERLRIYYKVDKTYHDCVVWIQLVHNARDKEINSLAAEQGGGGGALKHDITFSKQVFAKKLQEIRVNGKNAMGNFS